MDIYLVDPVDFSERDYLADTLLGDSETEIYQARMKTIGESLPPGPERMRASQDVMAEFSHIFSYRAPKELPF